MVLLPDCRRKAGARTRRRQWQTLLLAESSRMLSPAPLPLRELPPIGYSTNLHAAESVAELSEVLARFAGGLRARLGWERLGVDLRLGSRAIAELAEPTVLAQLRRTLDTHALSAHTLNGFPLGAFQAPIVKRDAYRPDWRSAERLADSVALIAIALALSDAPMVTISTVPGSYRGFGAVAHDHATIAANLGRWAAAAARAQRDTNRRVVLALEPEPWCTLETSWDVAAFWRGPLAEHGATAATAALDGDAQAGAAAVREHLGICFDTCHFSLAFEDQAAAVARLTAAQVPIVKCQVSAAPEVRSPSSDPAGVAALRALAEPRFLHQTAAATAGGSLSKVEDLNQLEACLARLPHADAVRSHFHIPLFWPEKAHGLSTTINDSRAGLTACRAALCTHIAVETYTWSILAPDERDAAAGTARELEWLLAND